MYRRHGDIYQYLGYFPEDSRSFCKFFMALMTKIRHEKTVHHKPHKLCWVHAIQREKKVPVKSRVILPLSKKASLPADHFLIVPSSIRKGNGLSPRDRAIDSLRFFSFAWYFCLGAASPSHKGPRTGEYHHILKRATRLEEIRSGNKVRIYAGASPPLI